MTADEGRRTVLFLQGPPSNFPRVVADVLEERGHRTLRINLSLSDWALWHDHRATTYRGRLDDWPAYLAAFVAREKVTDIIYYQDRFPYHSAALACAEECGLQAVSYENGYLRPDWITVERNGMSARSLFPDDVEKIRAIAADLPRSDMSVRYRHPFWLEAVHEVLFHVVNALAVPVFPHFIQDKFYHPFFEYLSMIPRLVLARRRDKIAKILIDDLIDSRAPYFVFPLQLQSDYQLRYNARFAHQAEALDQTIGSFARHAHPAAQLVVKVHPMDQGIEPWRRIVHRLALKHRVKRRVHFVDGGHLISLLRHASGAVMINSTTGLHAIREGCPVKTLGIAVYDLPGLTCQQSMERFWRGPEAPVPDMYEAMERLMAASIQIQGNFYTREGKAAAAHAFADRLIARRVNEPGAWVDPAPRAATAAAQGLPLTFAQERAMRARLGRWWRAWRG